MTSIFRKFELVDGLDVGFVGEKIRNVLEPVLSVIDCRVSEQSNEWTIFVTDHNFTVGAADASWHVKWRWWCGRYWFGCAQALFRWGHVERIIFKFVFILTVWAIEIDRLLDQAANSVSFGVLFLGVIGWGGFLLIVLFALLCGNCFIFPFILHPLDVLLLADPDIDPDNVMKAPFVNHVNQEEAWI
jgi:hypothetical protein